jgi:hypothetical protein
MHHCWLVALYRLEFLELNFQSAPGETNGKPKNVLAGRTETHNHRSSVHVVCACACACVCVCVCVQVRDIDSKTTLAPAVKWY